MEDGGAGRAHSRWFILDGALRGQGLSRQWLGEALAHLRARGFTQAYLWTLEGLPTAEKLYAGAGFVEAERVMGPQWFRPVTELRLIFRP